MSKVGSMAQRIQQQFDGKAQRCNENERFSFVTVWRMSGEEESADITDTNSATRSKRTTAMIPREQNNREQRGQRLHKQS